MNPELHNILLLADRDLAAGRCADAEAEYQKALEMAPEFYVALHGRGVAHAWQSSLYEGNPAALITSTDDALRTCRKTGGDEDELLRRVAIDLINLTSTKYNELTRIYMSVARHENQKAPSPLFFYTWSHAQPQGMTLPDIYLPMINYLASIILISEYLDGLLKDKAAFTRRRLHNIRNLAIFYDWLIAFNATGRVSTECYMQITAKRRALLPVRAQLEGDLSGASAAESKAIAEAPAEEQQQSDEAAETDKPPEE